MKTSLITFSLMAFSLLGVFGASQAQATAPQSTVMACSLSGIRDIYAFRVKLSTDGSFYKEVEKAGQVFKTARVTQVELQKGILSITYKDGMIPTKITVAYSKYAKMWTLQQTRYMDTYHANMNCVGSLAKKLETLAQ